jgi:hypothetical protein
MQNYTLHTLVLQREFVRGRVGGALLLLTLFLLTARGNFYRILRLNAKLFRKQI